MPEMRSQLVRASAMVTEMAVTVILGVLAGGWLDSHFSTSPIFLFLLSLGAFILGMVRMIRALNGPASNGPDLNDRDSPE